jgi:hypothetical protein
VDLLTKALLAAFTSAPSLGVEAHVRAAAEAYDTAKRFHREDRIESIVKSLLA